MFSVCIRLQACSVRLFNYPGERDIVSLTVLSAESLLRRLSELLVLAKKRHTRNKNFWSDHGRLFGLLGERNLHITTIRMLACSLQDARIEFIGSTSRPFSSRRASANSQRIWSKSKESKANLERNLKRTRRSSAEALFNRKTTTSFRSTNSELFSEPKKKTRWPAKQKRRVCQSISIGHIVCA